jgi:predicted O-linked N-acetylglucosamine transferase (SPINDLY family)
MRAEAYFMRGFALQRQQRLHEALDSYQSALRLDPAFAEAHNNRGGVLHSLNRLSEAIESFERALLIRPDYAEACYNRALALQALDRWQDALEGYERTLQIKPDYAEAFYNRGLALRQLGRLRESLEAFARALVIRPDFAKAANNQGNILSELDQPEEALKSYERALAIHPGHAEAHNNRGKVLQRLQRLNEALDSVERALQLKPDYAEAHYNHGLVLHQLRRFDDAATSFGRALDLKPDYAQAQFVRGLALAQLQQLDAARSQFDRALALQPQMRFLIGMQLLTVLRLCDWEQLDELITRVLAEIEADVLASHPLTLMLVSDSEVLHQRAAQLTVQELYPLNQSLPALVRRASHGRLRVGYFSPDFREHPVATLAAELFECHDRSSFEIVGFSLGPNTGDAMRQRLQGAFERFVDIRSASDREAALLSREMQLDVAVDLGGLTEESRPGIFALRVAPLQISYLGFPGSTGAPYMDYVIADRTVVPECSRAHYGERLIHLPHSYLPHDSTRSLAPGRCGREQCGLPLEGIVFCCFNGPHKILPRTFDCWMRLLRRVDGSVLWLAASSAEAAANLRREAERRDVAAARLVFAPRLTLSSEHLARITLADLFLDTWPYNAHATAMDALWAGLPVLTCTGESFAGRVGASLLRAADLPELITHSPRQYEELALELALDAPRLTSLRQRLARNRHCAPLFDTPRLVRQLEAAYRQVYERYRAGLDPDHLQVDSP